MAEKAKLMVEATGHVYRIIWMLEDDLGGYLGQNKKDGTGPAPEEREDWEHWAACKAVLEMPSPKHRQDSTSFYWESESDAKAARRVAAEALKHERPLPAWAKTAIEHGWKPPKGWKP